MASRVNGLKGLHGLIIVRDSLIVLRQSVAGVDTESILAKFPVGYTPMPFMHEGRLFLAALYDSKPQLYDGDHLGEASLVMEDARSHRRKYLGDGETAIAADPSGSRVGWMSRDRQTRIFHVQLNDLTFAAKSHTVFVTPAGSDCEFTKLWFAGATGTLVVACVNSGSGAVSTTMWNLSGDTGKVLASNRIRGVVRDADQTSGRLVVVDSALRTLRVLDSSLHEIWHRTYSSDRLDGKLSDDGRSLISAIYTYRPATMDLSTQLEYIDLMTGSVRMVGNDPPDGIGIFSDSGSVIGYPRQEGGSKNYRHYVTCPVATPTKCGLGPGLAFSDKVSFILDA